MTAEILATEKVSQVDHDETKQRIIDAAECVFAEIGYEAATVRGICERAGVKNIGAINYYFQGKENLYAAVVKNALHCCSDGMPFPAWGGSVPADRKLVEFIEVMMHRLYQSPRSSAMALMMREFAAPSPACRQAVLENIQPMAGLLRSILQELLPATPPDQLWLISFSIVGQCLYYRQNLPVAKILAGEEVFKRLDAASLAKHIASFSLAALGFAAPESVTRIPQ